MYRERVFTDDATEFFALADGDDDWRVVQLAAVLLLLHRGDTCQEQRGQILTAFAPRWFAVCFVARTVWAGIRNAVLREAEHNTDINVGQWLSGQALTLLRCRAGALCDHVFYYSSGCPFAAPQEHCCASGV